MRIEIGKVGYFANERFHSGEDKIFEDLIKRLDSKEIGL